MVAIRSNHWLGISRKMNGVIAMSIKVMPAFLRLFSQSSPPIARIASSPPRE